MNNQNETVRVFLESNAFGPPSQQMKWVYPLEVADWEETPQGQHAVVHLYGEEILRPMLRSLKQAWAEHPEFDDSVLLNLFVISDGKPLVYRVHWPDLQDSYEDVTGEDVIAFYTAPLPEAETVLEKTADTMQSPQAHVMNVLTPPGKRPPASSPRISYSGPDIQTYINDRHMELINSIGWSQVIKDGKKRITGTITFSLFEQHPLYEILGYKVPMGQGEPCSLPTDEDGVSHPIRSLLELPPVDILLVYQSQAPFDEGSCLTLQGVKFTHEFYTVSGGQEIQALFEAEEVYPLRRLPSFEDRSEYQSANSIVADEFSWSRPTLADVQLGYGPS